MAKRMQDVIAKSSRRAKAPSFDSGSDPFEKIESAAGINFLKEKMQRQFEMEDRANIGRDIANFEQSVGRKARPGEKFSSGGFSVEMNPDLDTEETKSVASAEVYPQFKNKVIELIQKGTLGSKKGLFGAGKGILPDVDRTVRQMAAQSGDPLTTYYDADLQNLQSKLNKLKEIMFERGGTALTPTEENILGAAFRLRGKSDNQIIEDIEIADALIQKKSEIALGGANAAGDVTPNPPNQNTFDSGQPPQEDRSVKLQSVLERWKTRNP